MSTAGITGRGVGVPLPRRTRPHADSDPHSRSKNGDNLGEELCDVKLRIRAMRASGVHAT